MSKRLDWRKPVAKTKKEGTPKTTFIEIVKAKKEPTYDLTARGVPDIKLIRERVDKAMRKYRRGL